MPETIVHATVLHSRAKAITLHLTLHHIKGVTSQPESLARKSTIRRHFEGRDVLALDSVSRGVPVHQVLEGEEPDAIGLRFAEDSDEFATVEAFKHAFVGGNLADAVERTGVQAGSTMRLGLKSDADMFDWARDDGVGDTGKGAGKVVLSVGEAGVEGRGFGIECFETSTGFMEGAELDADL